MSAVLRRNNTVDVAIQKSLYAVSAALGKNSKVSQSLDLRKIHEHKAYDSNTRPMHLKLEFIGILRHMQRYFSHICDGTDVKAY